jgi:hypothetical protein
MSIQMYQSRITRNLFIASIMLISITLILIMSQGCSSERGKWRDACAINSSTAYAEFIHQYPNSKLVDSARLNIVRNGLHLVSTPSSIDFNVLEAKLTFEKQRIFSGFTADFSSMTFDSISPKSEYLFGILKIAMINKTDSLSHFIDTCIVFKSKNGNLLKRMHLVDCGSIRTGGESFMAYMPGVSSDTLHPRSTITWDLLLLNIPLETANEISVENKN